MATSLAYEKQLTRTTRPSSLKRGDLAHFGQDQRKQANPDQWRQSVTTALISVTAADLPRGKSVYLWQAGTSGQNE